MQRIRMGMPQKHQQALAIEQMFAKAKRHLHQRVVGANTYLKIVIFSKIFDVTSRSMKDKTRSECIDVSVFRLKTFSFNHIQIWHRYLIFCNHDMTLLMQDCFYTHN